MTTLDEQTRNLLRRLSENPFPDLTAMEPAEMREAHAAFYASTGLPSDPSLADARDLDAPGPDGPVPVRVYTPRGAAPEPRPLLVYYHGGGMVAGSIDSYDAICRLLAARSGAVVVSAGYRLAPEHRFPAAVDDSYAALKWAAANAASIGADPTRVAVGGDSSGGNLAAVVAQMARDLAGPPLVFQLLVYPAVGTLGHSRSMARFATGHIFERKEYDWLYEQYLADPRDALDPRVSPIAGDLAGLPPALVITAGFDIMRDDAEAYARRLQEAGVPVVLHRYESTVHAFLSMAGVLDAGREAIEECATALRDAFEAARGFENDHVRIVRQDRACDGPAVVVDLGGGAVRYEPAGLPPGDAATPQIRVQLKAPPQAEPLGDRDAVRVEPGRYRVVFENERVRVVRLHFEPGEEGDMVAHPPRVLVTLTDVAVRLNFPDGRTDERGGPAGVAGWMDGETLRTRNVAAERLEVLLVEPKSAAGPDHDEKGEGPWRSDR